MANNPQVEVVWCKLEEQSQVRISGKVAVIEDAAIQQRFRQDNPMVDKLLPPGADHLFQLYKLGPEEVHMAEGLVPYTELAW